MVCHFWVKVHKKKKTLEVATEIIMMVLRHYAHRSVFNCVVSNIYWIIESKCLDGSCQPKFPGRLSDPRALPRDLRSRHVWADGVTCSSGWLPERTLQKASQTKSSGPGSPPLPVPKSCFCSTIKRNGGLPERMPNCLVKLLFGFLFLGCLVC